ncbi:MAG: TetR/AcrR family transcriptional regulator [Myxococcales bacterium]|nr:TetR/AcrR family transcriptional regulator [Myxococcales bacterium]
MPPALDSDPRRAQILGAVLEVCLAEGPDALTIAKVRQRCGASVGSIYHHFGDKQGMLLALYVAAISEFHEAFLGALEPEDSAEGMARAIPRAHVGWVVQHPDRARFLHMARRAELVRGDEPALKDQNRTFLRAVFARMEPLVQGGSLRSLPRDVLMAVMVGPADHFVRQWLAGRTTTPPERAIETLGEAAWRVLAPQDSA